MRTQNSRTVIRSAFFFFLFPLLFSCQTAPKIADAVQEESDFVPLDPGASAYVFMVVQKARPIMEYTGFNKLLDDKQLQRIIDKPESAVAAFYPSGSPRLFQIAAWGNYPVSVTKMALGTSAEWKKTRSPVSKSGYWYSRTRRLSVALGPQQAIISAAGLDLSNYTTDPFSAAPGTAVPEGFNEFRRGAILSYWVDNPGPVINQRLGVMGLPIEIPADRLFISLFPLEQEQYVAKIRLHVANAVQARALSGVFSIARGFISNIAGSSGENAEDFAVLASILFANPPIQEGNTLTITSSPLGGQEIALLFKMFSLQ